MPLRQPRRRTPALLAPIQSGLARNRASALKSTGPRTPEGKARVRWNALQHGRRALTLARMVEGRGEEARLYRWVLGLTLSWFEPSGPRAERRATRLAQQVWCALRGKGKTLRTNPKCPIESASYVETLLLRIHFRIDDRHSPDKSGRADLLDTVCRPQTYAASHPIVCDQGVCAGVQRRARQQEKSPRARGRPRIDPQPLSMAGPLPIA